MEVKVLGTGCRKCKKLFDVAEKAIESAGVDAELTKVEKIDEIASYGVAFTPALVVDGSVKVAGKIPKAAQIEGWLKDADQTE